MMMIQLVSYRQVLIRVIRYYRASGSKTRFLYRKLLSEPSWYVYDKDVRCATVTHRVRKISGIQVGGPALKGHNVSIRTDHRVSRRTVAVGRCCFSGTE